MDALNFLDMRIINIILFFIIFLETLSAQSLSDNVAGGSRLARLGKYQTVDKSFMECVYEHCIYDPYCDETRIEDEILEIGRKASRYGDYNNYLRDSIIKADYPTGITVDEFEKLGKKIGRSRLTETLKNFDEGKLRHFESIFGEPYVYDEEIPAFDWQFTDETDEVCGHKCKKATAEFRGRTWNAWYAEDIPIDNGPLKFGGLPGLILKIEDSDKEHIFEAMQVRKSDNNFGYKIRSLLISTDRKTFNKMLYEYKSNPSSFMNGSPLAPTKPDGSPLITGKRRVFYNPVEKDL
ncbi:MAG: GLPGLI family protein [Duncaniella sp.]|nr:GLPGLI family protein [Duncaniella sp.]